MECLNFLLFFLEHIRNEEESIIVRNVSLLENNFWSEIQDPIYVDKEKYLLEVDIEMADENNKWFGTKLTEDICFYFEHTKKGYFLFKDWMVKNIVYHLGLSNVDKSVLKFYFVYTEKPIKDLNHLSRCTEEKETYRTFKLLKNCNRNSCISLENDEIAIRMYQIKEMIKRLAKMHLNKLDRYISIIDLGESDDAIENIEGNTKFDICHFESYSKCFKSLKQFVKNLKPLTLVEDNTIDLNNFNKAVDLKSTLLVSEFNKRLKKKFDNDFKKYKFKNNKTLGRNLISHILCKSNDIYVEKDNIKLFKSLYSECCDYLRYEFLECKVLFPIEGQYNIEYYIEALSKKIFILFDLVDEDYDINNPRATRLIFNNIIKVLESNLSKFNETFLKDIFMLKLIDTYFPKLLGKEIKTLDDYISIEQIVRDYHNMFVYISNLACSIKDPSSTLANYYLPMFIDNYSCKIINAIEIKFEYPAIFGLIKAFNNEKKEVEFLLNVDYFMFKSNRLYITFEVLKKKDINVIEVKSFVKKSEKRFNIKDYSKTSLIK